jgi:hypothetical protein
MNVGLFPTMAGLDVLLRLHNSSLCDSVKLCFPSHSGSHTIHLAISRCVGFSLLTPL